jgi:hypothetical protein
MRCQGPARFPAPSISGAQAVPCAASQRAKRSPITATRQGPASAVMKGSAICHTRPAGPSPTGLYSLSKHNSAAHR